MISIIVLTHTGDLIYRCLDSIRNSIDVEYEIIVVADSYRDYGKDVKIILSKEAPAHKRNFGCNFAKGDYYVFLDDDTELTPSCLITMLHEMKKADMTYSTLINMHDRKTLDHSGAYLGMAGFLIENVPPNIENYILAGKSACCMIKKDWFYKVGQFDRDFKMFGEETDLSWRIWLYGGKVTIAPSICYHAFNTPLKDKSQYYDKTLIHFDGCKNYPTMLIKNLSAFRLCYTLPLHIIVWLIAYLGLHFSGQRTESTLLLKGLKYLWKERSLILNKRRHVQLHRVRKDKEISPYIMHKKNPLYYILRLAEYITQGRSGRTTSPKRVS